MISDDEIREMYFMTNPPGVRPNPFPEEDDSEEEDWEDPEDDDLEELDEDEEFSGSEWCSPEDLEEEY